MKGNDPSFGMVEYKYYLQIIKARNFEQVGQIINSRILTKRGSLENHACRGGGLMGWGIQTSELTDWGPAVVRLKGQYRHEQSRLSTGHGIGVLVEDEHMTENYWFIYAAALVI